LKGGNHSQQGEKQDLKNWFFKNFIAVFYWYNTQNNKRSEKTLEDKRIMNRDQQRKNNEQNKKEKSTPTIGKIPIWERTVMATYLMNYWGMDHSTITDYHFWALPSARACLSPPQTPNIMYRLVVG
jgi:hypothetical protein